MSNTDISLMEKEKITILVYTESFENCSAEMAYFEKASLFNEFEIDYLPVLNNNFKVNIEQCKYRHIREKNIIYSTIELKNSSGCIGTHNRILLENFDELTDEELNKLSERKIIEGNTYAAPFDLVVVSDKWARSNLPLSI